MKKENLKTLTKLADFSPKNLTIDQLESGLPRWLIETGFAFMLLAAICILHPIEQYTYKHSPVIYSLINCIGIVIMYYAMMKGMKRQIKPMSKLWIAIIVLNIAGSVATSIPSITYTVGLAVSMSLSLFYLPLGVSIMYIYRGLLQKIGFVMVIRIVLLMILPIIAFCISKITSNESIMSSMVIIIDAIIFVVELIYSWMLRKILIKTD